MPTVRQLIEYLAPAGTRPTPPSVLDANGLPDSPAGADPWTRPPVVDGIDPWGQFPIWPPDLFAITATLVSQAECYAHSRYAGSAVFTAAFLDRLRELADMFNTPFHPEIMQLLHGVQLDPVEVMNKLLQNNPELLLKHTANWRQRLDDPSLELATWWKTLTVTSSGEMVDGVVDPARLPEWWDAAMYLMIVADEACLAVGRVLSATSHRTVPNFAFDRYRQYSQAILDSRPWPGGPHLIQFPTSLCSVVPACKVSVQPKTHTVQVGCTINCMSHHLALLPPHSQVKTEWVWGHEFADIPPDDQDLGPPVDDIHLLVVPFPYTISPNAFTPGPKCSPTGLDPAHFFAVDPTTWLSDGAGATLSPERFVDELILPLVEAARQAGKDPEWLILPELALTESLARGAAERLAAQTRLQLFVTGIGAGRPASGFGRNAVFGAQFVNNQVARTWQQNKHHRWKLDRWQIEKYGLEKILDPALHWWEGIEVFDRRCVFWSFRQQASATTLVCEDLARIHPVQPVLRAVGPNLVVALLMDDEQVERRWSSRYATVLADDPGSSVLSITSLALIRQAAETRARQQRPRRFNICVEHGADLPSEYCRPIGPSGYKVAVWREAPLVPGEVARSDPPDATWTPREWNQLREGQTLPLQLDPGHHALVLTVEVGRALTFSLDGRSDHGRARLRLKQRQSLAHPNVPRWANYPSTTPTPTDPRPSGAGG